MCNYEDRHNTQSSTISRTSRRSDESYSSQSTAATSIYDDAEETFSNQLHRTARHCTVTYGDESKHVYSRYSRGSCGSGSEEGFYEEPEEYDYPPPSYSNSSSILDAIPTTSQDFASYFPSQRRLNIQHDPTTADGNMNLVVSTEAFAGARKIHMQLFHLRMHDLATRQFSLRRHCRDSGREVCHSIAATRPSAQQRPTLQRSMSHALATLSPGKRTNSRASTKFDYAPPARQDSGYVSNSDDEDLDDDDDDDEPPAPAAKPSSTTKLEFSNYAHVDVKRRGGAGSSRRWEFEYWGSMYAWKRESGADGARSYHLVKTDQPQQPIAHIVPEVRTTEQERAEARAGGWVPPCSLWIGDARVLGEPSDVADVVVATGLIALADDCGRRRAKGRQGRRPGFMRQISIPLSPVKLDMEFVHPVEMVRHMFRRGSKDSSAGSAEGGSRPGTGRSGSVVGRSPLGMGGAVAAF